MKTRITHREVLALVGMLALGIYVLACTSFSPDDTKVLYPAFDAPGGRLSVALYDRRSGWDWSSLPGTRVDRVWNPG